MCALLSFSAKNNEMLQKVMDIFILTASTQILIRILGETVAGVSRIMRYLSYNNQQRERFLSAKFQQVTFAKKGESPVWVCSFS